MRRAGNNTSSLTTASPRGNRPTHSSRDCCACTPVQQQMEVVGHEDPADEQAVHLPADFLEALDEVLTKAWGGENRRPAVGAGGDELQFTRAVSAMVGRHAAFEYTHRDGLWERVRSGVSLRDIADPKRRGLRQPGTHNRARNLADRTGKKYGETPPRFSLDKRAESW